MKKGERGFGEITYRGKRIVPDVDDSTHVAYFRHLFHTSFDGKYRRHACLRRGYWCWSNALRYPWDILIYLRRKL